MISTAVDSRGPQGGVSQPGRDRKSLEGRGRGFRPPSGNSARPQNRQHAPTASIGQPEQQLTEETYPPGLVKQQQQALQGFIAALRDSYGFIRVPGDQQQIFFHGSEVHDSDEDPDKQFVLQQLLQIGDEVSFDLKHIVHKEKKVNAINIRKLASGTIAAVQSAKMGRYRGIVKTTPGESSWRSAEVTPGVIVYTKPFLSAEPPSEQQVTYKPSNLKLRVGDKVEFSCVSGGEREVEASQATAVVLVARADSIAADDGPQHGCIVAVKEGFGFIRPAGRPKQRVYFRNSELVGGAANSIPLNAEVSYLMAPDPRGRQDMAAKIRILPTTFNAAQLTATEGKLHGRVAQVAKAPAESKLQDGLLNFTEGQTTVFCSYGAFQVDGGARLEVDDEVNFSAGVIAQTGAYKATGVSLLMTAAERSQNRELGQIKNMKKEFGFINCCERVADMFYHHSALEGEPEEFAVGNDVSFKVVKEPNGERPNAVEIRKVQQGSAVFEEMPQEQHTGKVVARLVPPNRGYNSAGESGLVAFEASEGIKQQLPFGVADLQDSSLNPAAGDTVTFRTATNIAAAKAAEKSAAPNRQYAGKRAVLVALVPQQGLIVSIAGNAGLLEFSQDQPYDKQSRDNKQRIPFQLPEGQDSTRLKPSDTVSFVVVTDARGKERSAHGVALVKEGDGVVPEESVPKNPNAMKFTGAPAEGASKVRPHQAVRIARGPDGTRGFTAALQPGNRARLLPLPPAPVENQAQPSANSQDQNGKPARKTAAAPTSRVSSDSNAESTQSQASARDRGQQQGGRGQPMAKTSAATRPTSASKQTNPTAILQPPSRQLSSSPVPRYHIASPNQSSQQPLHPSPGNVNAQSSGATSSGSPNGGMQSRRAQGEAASQGRRQRQQRASPSPGHNLHRQAVHARAEQAMMQEPGQAHGSELNSQPADASVLRVQQSNVMPNSAAGSAVPGVANGSPQVAQKASVGSADMQRTASGKLRATAAPFVPRSASGSPLSTSST